MRTVDEHRAVVAALLPPTPVEARPLADALGLVLAEDLRAAVALPPFDNSAMDGYAVRAQDVADAPVRLPVAEDIPAGRTDAPRLEPGTAHRIMTGAPMPPGADAVVQVEHTDGGTETVRIDRSVSEGTHVRRAGEDAEAGTLVLRAGTVLGAAQLGLAAAVGTATVRVRRPPRVLVLSTGSELVAPGEPLAHGQIYESNGVMLAAAVTEAGGIAEQLRFVPDDVEEFLAVLADRISRGDGVDLVLTSGGVSAGAYEVVKDALASRGVEFVRVGMQPGGPQGAGRVSGLAGAASGAARADSSVITPGDETPVVTLPGNPVSSQVSFEVFVRPALRSAMGHPAPYRPIVRARLAETLRSPAGRRQFRRGELDTTAGTVRTVGGPGSHLLSALARANCLIVLGEDDQLHEEGSEVDVWLLER
ncbi:gephyrin-like molybdotransferase Glp [Pseudonocardia acaciae]|uniref:molybdopterin molybdotransferase MoeA n=1 Tax=Pseudonocardia acaciae TaxID=551276 RepID=UPI00049153A6|nr:gephyrin-like molybdotransferase Glp [Pseudonocardia acaciae]